VTYSETLARAEAIAGYPIRDPDKFIAALTHASVANTRLDSNERLEFLGDAVLDLIVCEELFRRYPDLLEGDLTKIKSAVVARKACAEVADRAGLGELLFLGKGMQERMDLPSSLRAAVLESFIAAVYLDAGVEQARSFILEHFEPYIEQAAGSAYQDNYKSQLQQHAQKYFSATPQYQALDEQGPDHSKCFEVCVTIAGRTFPSAWGPSKKEAEQKAARRALEHLGVFRPNESARPAEPSPGSASP
jgi:ribonuclease-3